MSLIMIDLQVIKDFRTYRFLVILNILIFVYSKVIPSTVDVVKRSQCTCSVAEILRMELAILNKLSWNVKFVTAVDFLHIVSV